MAAPAVLWLSCAALLIFAAFKDGTQPEGAYCLSLRLAVGSDFESLWQPQS